MKNTFCYVAVRTRFELVTPCVTGMYSNQAELTHQRFSDFRIQNYIFSCNVPNINGIFFLFIKKK